MRKIVYIILLGLVSSACSNVDNGLQQFDWGVGAYKQPFRGLLKNEPSLLVKSMKYPPFKWCAPDTLVLHKSFELEFNEESIRSKSFAFITLADSLGRPVEGLSFIYNNTPVSGNEVKISADSIVKTLNLSIVVAPSFGENEVQGFVFVSGEELDVVNETSLQQENNILASWKCAQEYEWNFWLWFLWILCLLLILGLIGVIIYGLVKLGIYIYPYLAELFGKIPSADKHIKKKSISINVPNNKSNSLKREKCEEDWRTKVQKRTKWCDEIIML